MIFFFLKNQNVISFEITAKQSLIELRLNTTFKLIILLFESSFLTMQKISHHHKDYIFIVIIINTTVIININS